MSEFKNKTEKELHENTREKRTALRTFRFNISGSKTKHVKEGMSIRKDIARILTELNSK
jgi:ribosomal protein L29